MKVTAELIHGVLSASIEKRYKHFVSVAADWGYVWCPRDLQTWVFIEVGNGSMALPVWPVREFAELLSKKGKLEATPERIAVEKFLFDTLPAMEQSGKQISVLPRPDDLGFLVFPTRLAADIQSEIARIG